MCLRAKEAPIGLAKEYALQLVLQILTIFPMPIKLHLEKQKTFSASLWSTVNFPWCFLVPPNLSPYILDCISHMVIITKITFLIQSSMHLLPTVTKLIPSRYSDRITCQAFILSIDSPIRWALILGCFFISDAYMWALSKVFGVVQDNYIGLKGWLVEGTWKYN